MEELLWQRPSLCGDGNNCPEVAITGDSVYVRSSLRPTEVTQLTPTEWRDLLSGIRNGEFDI
ncbi:DUF397 domain-containing protein [Kitasatospora purpeofusca]|uniref:DUF397 domain-containing protein n=1 Tax=Kitasatospora purpeofusca TaxID=67352 RepID=UPI002A59DA42|nr:DUF397 domain-containing protein [Kitasatospora purpeofusca]MDY0810291.1 DUF397 domain-containing protein [Kitasatospora purpeofusca]